MEEDQGVVGLADPSTSKKISQIKPRKKGSKSWENILKAVASMDDAEKLSYIEHKYSDLNSEVRRLNQNNQQLSKQCTHIQKERDYNQAELAKSVVARARLENLCRELQKQNKQIKEENIAKIKEEEERRKEVSSKFADKLSDINNMMDENKEKSDKLREENLKMTAKLAELYDQFQKREDDIEKMSHQLELERQFSQATLAKMELEIKAEKEIYLKEQTILQSNLEKSENNCQALLETVRSLQEHIDVYKNQYNDFESTMSKSAKVFDNFKFEIANMNKQVAALEKECQTWKNKFQDSMKALVDLSELKKNQDVCVKSMQSKNEKLQKLCRQLQTDRSNYLQILKSNGLEPPTVPHPKAEHVAPKMTKKEKELQMLKENLKAVQAELNKFSVEEFDNNNATASEELAPTEGSAADESVLPPPPPPVSHPVLVLNNDISVIDELD